MPEENSDPQNNSGQSVTPKGDPNGGGEGQSSQNSTTEAHSQVPDHLKGKSVDELVRMQSELEKKLGEQSSLVAEAKKLKENQAILAKAIYSNPDLTKEVEAAVMGLYNPTVTETLKKDDKKPESDGEVKTPSQDTTEVRRTLENQMIGSFAENHGLNKLKPEERSDVLSKVGQKLADIYDPSGTLKQGELLKKIPLEKLPDALDNAYTLVYKDVLLDKGSLPTEFASIGRISASSGKSEPGEGLTERERVTAEKLGIKPEDYLKYKKQQKE